jgi:dihydroorotate dehydrogenase (NAD+) catalytic subunit
MVELVTKEVRKNCKKHLIVKLSPNVTNIKEIALVAESQGADALSLINTVTGMAIDIKTRKPKIDNVIGGLSGPAIKPIAIKMVHDVYKVVKIPILGMGGINSWEDAIEFFLAGASSIAIGTGNFSNPIITKEVLHGVNKFFKKNNINNVKEIKGKVEY